MGILESLGYSGPIAKFIGQNRNTLGQMGLGLAQGQNFAEGIGYAGAGALQGRQADDAYATVRKKEADDAARLEAAIENMRKYSPDIADLVRSGAMDVTTGWNETLKGWNQQPADPTSTYEGRRGLSAQYGLTGDAARNWELSGNLPEGNSLPTDYMPDPSNPNGMVPRPGSPDDYKRQQDEAAAAAEQQAATQAQQAASQNAAFTLQSANDAIERATKLVGPMTAGNIMGSQVGQSIPLLGQGAADLAAEIDTIESYIGLDKLMALKAASPTGASGLGSVTEKEMQLLTAAVASLRQTQDPIVLQSKLLYIKRRLAEWAARPGQQGAPGQQDGTPTIGSDADYDALPSGATFIAPDGTTRRKP